LKDPEGEKFYPGPSTPALPVKSIYSIDISSILKMEINQCYKCREFWVEIEGFTKLRPPFTDQREEAVAKYFATIIDIKISRMYLTYEDVTQQSQVPRAIPQPLCHEGG
tara:strand:+ start:906 stop:1232 length:327 start_codon:yes stop_codon:yes gene_type:complete